MTTYFKYEDRLQSSAVTGKSESSLTFTAPLCLVQNPLTTTDAEDILSQALTDQENYRPSETMEGTPDARRSILRGALLPAPLEKALVDILPVVEEILGVEANERRVECQSTIHQDGDYFHQHTDIGPGEAATRKISFVYYLHRTPRRFTGGRLRMYDTLACRGQLQAAASFREIEPNHNTLVFFPATVFHEVLPIKCASKYLEESRFSYTGWIH